MNTDSLVYYFRSITGEETPALHVGSEQALRNKFAGSRTPITRVIPVANAAVRNKLRAEFAEQLKATPKREFGLRFDLERIVKHLSA